MRVIWKKLSLSLLVLLPFAAGALWFAWELGAWGDGGWESGYYGQYNRVKHVIEEMPRLQITNTWKHHDVTLEDFGFFVLVDGSRSARVDFHENTAAMRERDRGRLRAYIEEQTGLAPMENRR